MSVDSDGGGLVRLEPQVFDLLVLLAQHPGRLVSRDELVEAVWGGRIVSESTISARINAARRAVCDDGERQAIIVSRGSRSGSLIAPASTGSRFTESRKAP
jgi:DNA-binding winged helix-turn-helix (wHTH) protein